MSDPSSPQVSGEHAQNPYGPPQPPLYQAPAMPPHGQQPHGQQPYGQVAYPQPGHQTDPDRRPGSVTAAGVITIILAGLTLVFGLLLVALGATGGDTFADGFRDGAGGTYDDFSNDDVNNLMIGIGVGLTVWCVAAIVLAILSLRRSRVARVLLVVSAAMCILVSLVGILSLISVVTLAGAIAVIVLLFVGGANDWYARRGQPMPPGTTQPWGQYPG